MLEILKPKPQPIQNPKSKIQYQNVRILLWDIDGTLLISTRQGAYKEYFAATMKKVYGSAGNLDEMQVSGKTDTQIIYEALRDEGFTIDRVFAEKNNLLELFKWEMAQVIERTKNPFRVLAGVREILAETDVDPRFCNALLTGNLSVAAEIKLRTTGLWSYFENQPNAFGEISHDRGELAHQAGKLFNEHFNYKFQPHQFIVIGDTPNDISCARAFGAKSVAVATGRNHPPEELIEYEPDTLLDNLENTKRVLRVLETV